MLNRTLTHSVHRNMLLASLAIGYQNLSRDAAAGLTNRFSGAGIMSATANEQASNDGNREHEGDETIVGGHWSLLSFRGF